MYCLNKRSELHFLKSICKVNHKLRMNQLPIELITVIFFKCKKRSQNELAQTNKKYFLLFKSQIVTRKIWYWKNGDVNKKIYYNIKGLKHGREVHYFKTGPNGGDRLYNEVCFECRWFNGNKSGIETKYIITGYSEGDIKFQDYVGSRRITKYRKYPIIEIDFRKEWFINTNTGKSWYNIIEKRNV